MSKENKIGLVAGAVAGAVTGGLVINGIVNNSTPIEELRIPDQECSSEVKDGLASIACKGVTLSYELTDDEIGPAKKIVNNPTIYELNNLSDFQNYLEMLQNKE